MEKTWLLFSCKNGTRGLENGSPTPPSPPKGCGNMPIPVFSANQPSTNTINLLIPQILWSCESSNPFNPVILRILWSAHPAILWILWSCESPNPVNPVILWSQEFSELILLWLQCWWESSENQKPCWNSEGEHRKSESFVAVWWKTIDLWWGPLGMIAIHSCYLAMRWITSPSETTDPVILWSRDSLNPVQAVSEKKNTPFKKRAF